MPSARCGRHGSHTTRLRGLGTNGREQSAHVRSPAADVANSLGGEGKYLDHESRRRWARRIAYGLPGDDGTMRFRFSPGDPNDKKLVATPGLSATIVVDRGSSHIMSVRFHGRRDVNTQVRGMTGSSVVIHNDPAGVQGRVAFVAWSGSGATGDLLQPSVFLSRWTVEALSGVEAPGGAACVDH